MRIPSSVEEMSASDVSSTKSNSGLYNTLVESGTNLIALPNEGNTVYASISEPTLNGQAPALPVSAVLHRSLHQQPRRVVEAQGCWLTLDNGHKILDATGGAAVACLGHGHEAIKNAMFDQINTVSYCHSLFYGTAVGEALADSLIASTIHQMARAFIVSSGSEAMEAAVKMARQYFMESKPPQPNRVRFIARKQSYHGTTLGSLAVGGHVARRELYEPLLIQNVSHVSPCYAYRGMEDGERVESYVSRLADELDREFQRVGPDSVCAFVAEPIVGAVGLPR